MLSGLKILDMSRVLAGPHCAMLLGELGAEVLKVESPGGDDTRGWGPPYQNGESAYFIGANRNKHSITLDLRQSKDLQTLRELIPQYDAVVENFKLGTLARWGFDADWFARHAPQTVHCSIMPSRSLPNWVPFPGSWALTLISSLVILCPTGVGKQMLLHHRRLPMSKDAPLTGFWLVLCWESGARRQQSQTRQ